MGKLKLLEGEEDGGEREAVLDIEDDPPKHY